MSATSRLRAWLRAHAAAQQPRRAARAARPESPDAREPAPASRPPAHAFTPATDRAVTALYEAHYQPLVRLAALLVRDMAPAEQIGHDSCVALRRSRRWQAPGAADSSLRHAVVHRARSVLRRRTAPGPDATRRPPAGAAGGRETAWQDPAVLAALHALPARQREALVL